MIILSDKNIRNCTAVLIFYDMGDIIGIMESILFYRKLRRIMLWKNKIQRKKRSFVCRR